MLHICLRQLVLAGQLSAELFQNQARGHAMSVCDLKMQAIKIYLTFLIKGNIDEDQELGLELFPNKMLAKYV
jgi:hypothetical protein